MAVVIVLMGVSGCGKTTVGQALAGAMGCPFYDGDDFHPLDNVAKMTAGIPLTDEDRSPWLARLRDLLAEHLARGETAVLACSALKKQYRDSLRAGNEAVLFVYLHGDIATIRARVRSRQEHYMKAGLLQSQFDALEPPGPDEAITIPITQSVAEIVNEILNYLATPRPAK